MQRLIAAALAFGLCFSAGALKAERMRMKIKGIVALTDDLLTLETLLKYERLSVNGIVGRLTKQGRLTAFWESMNGKLKDGLSFAGAFKACASQLHLDRETLLELEPFAQSFGSSDIKTELSRLRLVNEKLAAGGQKLQKELPNRIRLCRSLSSLLGAALALLVL